MGDSEMIALATPADATISRAEKKLAPAGHGIYDAEWISTGLAKGFYRAREIQRDGKPVYVAFYHVDDQNFLVPNGGAFVGDGEPDSWLWKIGLEKLARELKCRGVTFQTRRRGLVEQATRDGYKIEGVVLSKILENEKVA
jgi:hypothetical protein